ncbi:DUF692 domain-containing protein [Simkania negevensis]|uniref:DUF692 domain-containing protein n=1 Tax=Simkania negevensis TaxID=83561 RepID=A0ABS3AX21_9BACT|nr:DUF692 domain-containing protein [Simkania negevensis]
MIHGVGLGFRKEIADDLLKAEIHRPSFVELAPENWIGLGGRRGRMLREIIEQYPILCHGLSLSLGSEEPFDKEFLRAIKRFLDLVNAEVYSEHLSFSKCNNAHLYDLLPLPFREDAIKHVIARIKEVQNFLERPIAIENVSYYSPIAPEMTEAEFICAIVEESGCNILLDVNNVYVNAFNHKYDAHTFISSLPLDKVVYIHMAGHDQESEDLLIDTHGEAIIDPVYDLFQWTIERLHPVPVLLERDHNLPKYSELYQEVTQLQTLVQQTWKATTNVP